MTPATTPPAPLDTVDGPGRPVERRGRHVAPWIAAGVAVGVTVLVAGGLAIGGRGPLGAALGAGPDVLHIGTSTTGGGSADAVVDPQGLRAGRYVLTGALPTSPTSATAWWLTAASVSQEQVAALASSLGLTAPPSRDGSDWVVQDHGAVLRVYGRAGLPFAFDASPSDGSCPSIPTDGYGGPDSAVGCVMTAPAPATAPPPGPDDAELRRLARAAAAALGSAGQITVWRGTPYGSAMVDPILDGVPTSGAGLTIQASTEGVLAASGWLGGFLASGQEPGDRYPLRSAADVFGDLASMPEPAIACAESMADGPACGGDVILTGASYGLSMAFDDGRPVLVPAWLFTVQGSSPPMGVIAVQQRYLGDPAATGSGSGGGTSGTSPGNAGAGAPARPSASDLPLDVDPAVDPIRDPGAPVGVPRGPLVPGASVTVIGPRELQLHVTGGCELQTAVAAAKETATTVVLSYTFQPLPCPSAQSGAVSQRSLQVTLEQDLAGRVIVDETGRVIPEGDVIEDN